MSDSCRCFEVDRASFDQIGVQSAEGPAGRHRHCRSPVIPPPSAQAWVPATPVVRTVYPQITQRESALQASRAELSSEMHVEYGRYALSVLGMRALQIAVMSPGPGPAHRGVVDLAVAVVVHAVSAHLRARDDFARACPVHRR